MIFGAKNLYTTNEIIDSLLSSGEIKNLTGAVSITRKEGRKTVGSGKIYFRNELIYAVEITDKEIPIGRRVATGRLVPHDDLNDVYKMAKSETSPRIVDYLLEYQLINESPLRGYVKDHFIETLGEILSWDNSLGEWQPNVTTNNFVMPYVSLDKIRNILQARNQVMEEFNNSVQRFFRVSEIKNLTYTNSIQDTSIYSPEIQSILRMLNGELTINDISEKTGLSYFTTFQTIISFWKKDLVTLKLGGITLPHSALAINQNISSDDTPIIPQDEIVTIPLVSEPLTPAVESSNIENSETVESIQETTTVDNENDIYPDENTDMLSPEKDSKDEIHSLDEPLKIEDSIVGDINIASEEDLITVIVEDATNNQHIANTLDQYNFNELTELEEMAKEFSNHTYNKEPVDYDSLLPQFVPPVTTKEEIMNMTNNITGSINTKLLDFTAQLNGFQQSVDSLDNLLEELAKKKTQEQQEVLTKEATVSDLKLRLENAVKDLTSARESLEELDHEESKTSHQQQEIYREIENLVKSFKMS